MIGQIEMIDQLRYRKQGALLPLSSFPEIEIERDGPPFSRASIPAKYHMVGCRNPAYRAQHPHYRSGNGET